MQYVVRMLLLFSLLFSPLWVAAGPVDINSADAQALDAALQGVGPKKAEAIVADRDKNGPFKSLDDLTRVKGINAKTVEENRANMTLGGGKKHAQP